MNSYKREAYKKKTIHVTFLDLADVFGSVEHNLINYTLKEMIFLMVSVNMLKLWILD